MSAPILPEARPPLRGEEAFMGVEATVLDFWAFAMPDLRVNNVRGWLAEYLVWRALGVERPTRREWDTHDVEVDGNGHVPARAIQAVGADGPLSAHQPP